MKLLYLSAHSILEHDQLKLWSRLGVDVFSLGAYLDPLHPGDDKRPPVPEAADHPELREIVHHVPGPDKTWNAKMDLPWAFVDWCDTVLIDAFPEAWVAQNWEKIHDKRVIWRTIGQSGPDTERLMAGYRRRGLEIVRYSPAEKRAFEPMGFFAGEDAMIRFGKDPADWYGWTGSDPVVGNVTQNMAGRPEFCGLDFWLEATKGLPAKPAGPGSEALPGGIGTLDYEAMREYLRTCRVYLYTGTQPASYTLGLIEAMMTGCPTVSIPKGQMWMPDLFEGDEIARLNVAAWESTDHQIIGTQKLLEMLAGQIRDFGEQVSVEQRQRAIDLFGTDTVGAQWAAYLGVKVAVPA